MSGLYVVELVDVLTAAGVECRVDDVNAGWEQRARSSGGFPNGTTPLGTIIHHTASATSPYNDLSYMIHGSDDAPIGNMLLDRDGVVWPIAAGASNCAGKGGPYPFSRGTVPLDSGNSRCWNIEAANNGVGEVWPQAQIDAYFAAMNALSDHFGNVPTDVASHAAWTLYTRKIDPATAAAVQGPWRPASMNSSGTWDLDDVLDECTRRATTPEPEPPTPPSEEDLDMAFIIHNTDTGEIALVYGDGKVTGLAGQDLGGYVARFGEAIDTDPVVFADFISKD